ncbi:hypothetical protein [Nocardioides sp. TF02-7]|uniref:hypothetical protein n=1 Tax=Nocardioides sp. TF02-7 TaxID=2917724 RepID=UPI001F07106A|nr:hypothetical protein [Nocardioides sp. TF02-7]UMG92057.1 hypothetical protein MF408_19100 [Nocardioides sp. TF02-7]
MPSSQAFAVVAAARLFALIAIGAPALYLRQTDALIALLVLAVLWTYQVVTATRRELELTLSPAVEATAVGIVCAIGMKSSDAILAALVVPPLYATAVAGTRTMVRTVAFQVVSIVSLGLMWHGDITGQEGVSIFTWSMAGVGLSLVAGVTFASDYIELDPLAPYRDAQHLIRQLIELSDNLSSGLDVPALGGEVLAVIGDRLPTQALALFVPRGDALSPVAATTDLDGADTDACEQIATDAWAQAAPVTTGRSFALPVGDAAVVAGLLPEGSAADDVPFDVLKKALAASVVKFDTALLFLPTSATSPRPASASGWPGRCTTGWPRTSRLSATSSTRWRPARPTSTRPSSSRSSATASPRSWRRCGSR